MTDGRPPGGTRLCDLADLTDPGAKGFRFREGDALFHGFIVRLDNQVRGWVDRCPHAGLPLAFMPDRYLTAAGDMILCGAHGSLFRHDGLCIGGPCAGQSLTPWAVRIEGQSVVVA